MVKDESIREKMFASIASWLSSDLSQKQWCQDQGITYHIFHYWYRKYRDEHPESTGDNSFVRLTVTPEVGRQLRSHLYRWNKDHLSGGGARSVPKKPIVLAVLHLSSSCKYYLYRSPVNMRKSFDGLTGIVQNDLKADPLSGAIFIFLNRRRNQVKLLLWEGDGFSLYHKRLEKGSYELPVNSDGQLSVTIEADQLLLLLKGISLRHIRRRKRYQHRAKIVDNQAC